MRRALVCALAVMPLALAGCGGTSLVRHRGDSHSSSTSAAQSALDRSVTVIKGWSSALRSGDVRRAAGYFQIPSAYVNAPEPGIAINSRAIAIRINEQLPCGALFLSAARQGRYVNALFRLSDRPGPGGGPGVCGSGAGQTARVDFVIRGSRIVEWLRAPDEPGDNGSSPGTATSPGTNTVPPGTATSPGTNTVPPGTATSPGTNTVPAGPDTTPTQTAPGTTPLV